MGTAVTLDAPAKVNLALRVGPLGSDGYHDVTTVMLTVSLADTLTATPAAPGVSLVREPEPGFPVAEDLAMRAVLALADAAGRIPAIALRLEKRIPIAAGLGGGSADCAAALAACCALWSIDLDDPMVTRVAASLGADVPFMVRGGCALYGGRGDRREAALDTPALDLVLVNAGMPVPTAEVYRAFDAGAAPRDGADVEAVARAVANRDPSAIASALANDLTDAAVRVAPGIADVTAHLRRQPGILGVLLAGSGGTVFGVAGDRAAAEQAAAAARSEGWWASPVSSVPSRNPDAGPLCIY